MSDPRERDVVEVVRSLLVQSPIARANFDKLVEDAERGKALAAEVEDMRTNAHRELVRLNGEVGYERWRTDSLRKRLTEALAEYERGWPSPEKPETEPE